MTPSPSSHRILLTISALLLCSGINGRASAATNCGSPGPDQAVAWKSDWSACDILEVGSYPSSVVQTLSSTTSNSWRYVVLGSNVWWADFGPGEFDVAQGLGILESGEQWVGGAQGGTSSFTISRWSGARRLVDLTPAERATLLQLIQGYLTEEVINIHVAHHDWHHYNHLFFTGHRGYLAGMEAYFRAHGGEQFVPIPTWDPSVPIPSDFAWVKPDQNGIARAPLQNLNVGMTTPGELTFPGCWNFYLDPFAADFEPFHDGVHNSVGGTMSNPLYSPAAAIFWPWHSYVDQIYTNWLQHQWWYCA